MLPEPMSAITRRYFFSNARLEETMIDRDSSIKEQVKHWLDECYNPDSTMSSTEKLSQAYRLISALDSIVSKISESINGDPYANERAGEV
jgi:hypothetical protein